MNNMNWTPVKKALPENSGMYFVTIIDDLILSPTLVLAERRKVSLPAETRHISNVT